MSSQEHEQEEIEKTKRKLNITEEKFLLAENAELQAIYTGVDYLH